MTTTAPALRSGRRVAFAAIAAGNFLVLLDTSILNVALPALQRDFGASDGALPWTSVSYTIAFAGCLLAAGAIADRFGSLRMYRGALVAFALVSLACAAAPTIGVLIGLRVLLGIAAACLVPASIALLAGLYPQPAARARAIGTWAAVTSIGLLAGPLLGGLLVSVGSWRLIFVINLPVTVFALLLVRRSAGSPPTSVRPLDLPGIALSIVLLASATYGLIDGGTNGWARPIPVVAIGTAVLASIALVLAERRSSHPVLPPALLARPEVSANIVSALVATLVFYGILFTLTLWLQRVAGLTPLETGLTFVPMTLPMCVLPIFTGRLVARFGARRLILFGLGCDVLAGAALIGSGIGGSPMVWIVLAEIALVVGSTTVIPAATAATAVAAPAEYAGSAQGALNAGRQAGSALGVAILGPLSSLAAVGWVLAALALATLLLSLAGPRRE